MSKRSVCVILVDRANYGRMKPVMHAIEDHPGLDLQTICTGTMVLERFGEAFRRVEADGFEVTSRMYIELEGSVPTTMAKSVGIAVIEFSTEFRRLDPDIVLLIGDRYEALAAAISAAYMNICIVHIQGGEVSGSIDESARHAISKFAHFHVPSTCRSSDYLVRMGETPESILTVGCPSSDLAASLDLTLTDEMVNSDGSGIELDVTQPYMLVVFHPTTTEFGQENDQMAGVLEAVHAQKMQALMLWPNIDAGSDHISKVIRIFRDQHRDLPFRFQTNYSPQVYLRILANAACAVGNSSSFVRDAGYFGTPVVLVGNRQHGRECDEHVTWTDAVSRDIAAAL
ncbi:MAG: UDP-N-acetylglucosamine 2-epimerase, partial [Verrucomicrobiota bacterium]